MTGLHTQIVHCSTVLSVRGLLVFLRCIELNLPVCLECLPLLKSSFSYIQLINSRVGAECISISIVLRSIVVGISHGQVRFVLDGEEFEVSRTICLQKTQGRNQSGTFFFCKASLLTIRKKKNKSPWSYPMVFHIFWGFKLVQLGVSLDWIQSL